MAPNWQFFKDKFAKTIDRDGESLSITIKGSSYYDEDKGTAFGTSSVTISKALVEKTSKNDIEEIPQGYRTKLIKKVYTVAPIDNNATITRNISGEKFQVVKKSDDYTSGNLVIGYITYIARIENQ